MMITLWDRRRTERVKVMLSATVEKDGGTEPTRLANLSAEGALLVGPTLKHGTPVRLQRNGTDIQASVTWSKGNESGLKFEQGFDVATALRTIPPPKRLDTPRSRRPGLKCAPISDAEKATFERWLNTGPQLAR
jgi:hypothetical protein